MTKRDPGDTNRIFHHLGADAKKILRFANGAIVDQLP
jgi:hypothetical protein